MSEKLNNTKILELEEEINDGRARLSSDRMDISFGELINIYKNQELIIKPDYQRLFRWTTQQKTDLIESLLLGIPIPPIFVAEDANGIWELVDGLQRVATVISFFGELNNNVTSSTNLYETADSDAGILNEENSEINAISLQNNWELNEGGLLKKIKGLSAETMPNKYKINLKRAVCRVEILRGEDNTQMKYELFKRLNSGGVKLTPQEMRNAIYRAINPQINDLVLELSQTPTFKKLTKLSKQKCQELYDQELVLKFIALFNNIENANDNTENLLNNFMDKAVNDTSFNAAYYRDIFNKVLSLLDALDDPNIFRTNKGLFIPSEFEGITIGVAENIDKYLNNPQLLKDKIQTLKTDTDFKKFSGSASNSKGRIKNRLTRANQIFSAS